MTLSFWGKWLIEPAAGTLEYITLFLFVQSWILNSTTFLLFCTTFTFLPAPSVGRISQQYSGYPRLPFLLPFPGACPTLCTICSFIASWWSQRKMLTTASSWDPHHYRTLSRIDVIHSIISRKGWECWMHQSIWGQIASQLKWIQPVLVHLEIWHLPSNRKMSQICFAYNKQGHTESNTLLPHESAICLLCIPQNVHSIVLCHTKKACAIRALYWS